MHDQQNTRDVKSITEMDIKSITLHDIQSMTKADILSMIRKAPGADDIVALAGSFAQGDVNIDWKSEKQDALAD